METLGWPRKYRCFTWSPWIALHCWICCQIISIGFLFLFCFGFDSLVPLFCNKRQPSKMEKKKENTLSRMAIMLPGPGGRPSCLVPLGFIQMFKSPFFLRSCFLGILHLFLVGYITQLAPKTMMMFTWKQSFGVRPGQVLVCFLSFSDCCLLN